MRSSFLPLAALFPCVLAASPACKAAPAPDATTTATAASVAASAASAATAQPSVAPAPRADVPLPPEAAKLAAGSNALGYELYRSLPAGNAALSPVSIELALAMTAEGARGATRKEMEKVLHLDGASPEAWGPLGPALTDHGAELRVANRLFVEKTYPLTTSFRALTDRSFGAAAEPVDYLGDPEGARGRINGWVDTQTNHRIHDLLPAGSVDQTTRLTLANAIELTAKWDQAFTVAATSPAPFHLDGVHAATVPTMHRTDELRSGAVEGAHVVKLPYQGGVLAMTIVVPDAIDGLPALEARLSASTLARIDGALVDQPTTVALPRFTIDPATSLPLGPALARLGMPSAFDHARADFSGIAERHADTPFAIGAVFHKAFVKVDESGTEAAAATAVVSARAAAAPRPALVVAADRPFLFLVREAKTGMVLFLGRVTNPG